MAESEFHSKFKRGVSLLHKFPKSLYYSVQCDCGSEKCAPIIEIECDDEVGIIQLHFYKTLQFDFWSYSRNRFGFLFKFIHRFIAAIKLIVTGRIEMEGDFVIVDEEHIKDFADALLEGREYCLRVNQSKN